MSPESFDERGNGSSQEHSYTETLETSVSPFVTIHDEDDVATQFLDMDIASVLDGTDDAMITLLQRSEADAFLQAEKINDIIRAIKENRINPQAPWLPLLQEKLLRYQLYIANVSDKELTQGADDFAQEARDAFARFQKRLRGKDDTEKE